MSTDAELVTRVLSDEQQRAMRVLAIALGDGMLAASLLKEEGLVSWSKLTLDMLRRGDGKGVYETYREELAPTIEAALVADQREIAGRAAALEMRLMDEISKKASQLDDPARALASVTRAKQASIEKLMTLTGRPAQITERRDASQLLRRLEAMNVLVPLGPPGELVEGEFTEADGE